jgi:hypothetical protein
MLLKNPFEKIQVQLEKLLDGENGKLAAPANENQRPQFHASTDLSHLRDILRNLPDHRQEFYPTLFSRLSLYFDAGLLMKIHPVQRELSRPEATFFKGEYYELDDSYPWIQLPALPFHQVARFHPHSVLAPLALEPLCDSDHGQGLGFLVSEEHLFLLFSELPEIWLKPHIAAVHEMVLKISADVL